jgi:hypothetical protein
MKKYVFAALIGMLSLGMTACGGKQPAEQSQTEEVALQLSWKIENLGMDSMGYAPVSRLTLLINGKEELLGEVSQPLEEIPAEQFAEKGIPADAAVACGGFWGGATTNYYAILKDNDIVIMSGGPNENEETFEQQPFIYEVFKTIKWR